MTEPCDLPATSLWELIGARALSPVELLSSCLRRIEQVNPAVNAVVALDEDRAMVRAREAEAQAMRGEPLGALHGLPVLIKDTEDVVGLACGMAPIASGSDTGGSLRNPAAFNGVVGFRPSPGLVPNEKRGLGWFSLSVNRPMARNLADTALMLSAMAGDNTRDPLAYTLPGEPVRRRAERYAPPLEVRLSSLRLAFTEDFGFAPTERHIRRVFRTRIAALAPLFAGTDEATPDCTGADDSFAVLRAALFLHMHGKTFRERPEMLGPNVRANVKEGLGYSLEDYTRAAGAQTRIYRSFQDFFAQHDVLVSPTITLSPRPWTELYPAEIDGQPTRSYFHWLALAYGVTLAGHPAISLPLGVDEAGMPFGLQIVGPRGGDAFVLGVAAALEGALAGDPILRRPVPDLGRLAAAPPISAALHFHDWE
ncbi:amidase [Roseomonas sp. GCM10028921]